MADPTVTVEYSAGFDARLRAYGTMLRDFAPFLKDELIQLRAATRTRFDTQGGDVGGWKPLNERYAAWKATRYPGQPILVASGEMRHGLVEEGDGSIGLVDSFTLKYGTTVEHARFHQYGTSRMPARRVLNMDDAQRKALGERLRAYMVRTVQGAS